MWRRKVQRKHGTTHGSPRRKRTARASGISRKAAKSGCAHEWGGWGRLSEDGPRQHNSDRSEGPWGRAEDRLHGGAPKHIAPDTEQGIAMVAEEHEGRRQTDVIGKASSDSPALKPYRGKPAVRNFRGGDGNVGIIRSPVRAIALPDYEKGVAIRSASSLALLPRGTQRSVDRG
jgi:hypothetical protein